MVRQKLFCLLFLLTTVFPAKQTYSKSDYQIAPHSNLRKMLQRLPLFSHHVAASVYFPEKGQTDSQPLITADGSQIDRKNVRKHRWIAVSRNLLRRWGGRLHFGDSVTVSGISSELDGTYVIRDTMNRRLRNTIDILLSRHDSIMGHWDNVQITKFETTSVSY